MAMSPKHSRMCGLTSCCTSVLCESVRSTRTKGGGASGCQNGQRSRTRSDASSRGTVARTHRRHVNETAHVVVAERDKVLLDRACDIAEEAHRLRVDLNGEKEDGEGSGEGGGQGGQRRRRQGGQRRRRQGGQRRRRQGGRRRRRRAGRAAAFSMQRARCAHSRGHMTGPYRRLRVHRQARRHERLQCSGVVGEAFLKG